MNQLAIRYQAPSGTNNPKRSYGLFAMGGNGTAYLTLAAICFATFVYAFVADLLGEIGEIVRIVLIVLTGLLTMWGAAICLFRGYLLPFFVSITGLMSIFLFLFIFAANSGVPFTITSGGEFIGLTFTGLFYLTIKDRTYGKLMRWFYWVCISYALYYIIASLALRLGLIDAGGVARAVASADDAGRSDRLHSASAFLVYGTCYSVVLLRNHFLLSRLLCPALFCFAWFLTESRAITLILLLVVIPYVFLGQTKRLKLPVKVVFYICVIGSIMAILDPGFNPFVYFSDQSAFVRANSLGIVSDSKEYYWLFGAGISFGIENYRPLTGITYFFPSDIGMVGIFYTYGVFGFMLYVYMCKLGLDVDRTIGELGYSVSIGRACAMSGMIFAIYSVQSPQYNGGSSGSIFAMMLLALYIYKGQCKAAVRRAARASSSQPAVVQ